MRLAQVAAMRDRRGPVSLMLAQHAGVLLLALLLEAAFGYPARLYRAVGHPVTWMGALLSRLEAWLNVSGPAARFRGVIALVLLLGATGFPAFLIALVLGQWGWLGIAASALLASSLLAQRSLHDHVAAVALALETEGLDAGRRAVSMIVGRDPQALDEAGVCRAAIESLAENFSDGVVAPAFWIGLAGLPGGALYKAANTADSMIGHRTPRFERFGWAAARFDDLINLPASRLSAALLVLAAALHPDTDAAEAAGAIRRDAMRHRSPNAGWPEAAMAGALGLRLAGPRTYAGVTVADAWMGNGRADATAGDIRRALRLYRAACLLLSLLALVVLAAARLALG